MSSTPKVSAQEVANNLAQLINRSRAAQEMFGSYAIERRFFTWEVSRGIFVFLEELPGRVMAYTTEQAVVNALLDFTDNLRTDDKEVVLDLKHYKLTASRARAVVAYWAALSTSLFTKRIFPVLERSQEGYCWRRLPFDAKQMETPLFERFLARIKTNREAFLAFNGGLLDADFRRQFYLWMWGVGGDGKGTWMRLLKDVFGDAYTIMSSSVRAQESQFWASGLLGKRIAAFQDCHNAKLPRSEGFMQLSGGDPLRIEQKGKDAYVADVDALAMVSSNDKADITNSPAHIRRLISCEFTPITDTDGPEQTYEARLREELPGIIWRCKEAWRVMKEEHGGMVVDRETSKSIADEAETRFAYIADKYFELQPGARGPLQYEMHGVLAERERLSEHEFGQFKKYLLRVADVSVIQPRDNGQKRMWIGIVFKKLYALPQENSAPSF